MGDDASSSSVVISVLRQSPKKPVVPPTPAPTQVGAGRGRPIAVALIGIGVNVLLSGQRGDPSTLLSSPTQEELRRANALLRHAAEVLRRANTAR